MPKLHSTTQFTFYEVYEENFRWISWQGSEIDLLIILSEKQS